jgi:hypothetical protein
VNQPTRLSVTFSFFKRILFILTRTLTLHLCTYVLILTSTSIHIFYFQYYSDIERAFQNCLEQLKGFDVEGYSYQPSVSTDKCMVFNRSELPPNTLGCDDDGEDEDGDGEEKKNKENLKKTKTAPVFKDKKTEVQRSKEKKIGTKIDAKKKGGKDDVVEGEEEGEEEDEQDENEQEEKKRRTTLSRYVKILGTKIEVKSDIDVKENKKIRGGKAVQKIGEVEVEKRDEVEVKSDKIETKAKGNGRTKRTQDSALSSSDADDKLEAVIPDTEYPIPTAKRTRSTRSIK